MDDETNQYVPRFLQEQSDTDTAARQSWSQDDYAFLIHRDDANAIETINKFPGFKLFIEGAASVTAEQMFRGEALGTNIKLDFDQFGNYYKLLPPICEKFGISRIPDLFLELAPNPCAYTYGAKNPFIVISTGLLDLLAPEEIQLVLARECGHIVCQHPLYNMLSSMVRFGVSWLPFKADKAVQLPIYAWRRASELTADRAMLAFAGNVKKAMNVIVRLSGCTRHYADEFNFEVYGQQLKEYKALTTEPGFQQAMQELLKVYATCPFFSIRSLELEEWSRTENFKLLSKKIGCYDPRCPRCGAPLRPNTSICLNGHFS